MINEQDITLLSFYLEVEGKKATATQIWQVLGYKSIGDVNLHVARLAKKLADQFSYQPTIRENGQKRWWPCLFKGENTKDGFVWTLKDDVAEWFSSTYVNDIFYQKVTSSLSNYDARKTRLLTARTKPKKIQILTWGFIRNPDVVAEVLFLANGKCQECSSDAPFKRRKDNTPYLEVHHKLQLSQGGEDTVKNSIALCPNCHREKHFG
jgi:5-methylcytosine-specific restriction endonuclease McrA